MEQNEIKRGIAFQVMILINNIMAEGHCTTGEAFSLLEEALRENFVSL
jgi:hypothetical protein